MQARAAAREERRERRKKHGLTRFMGKHLMLFLAFITTVAAIDLALYAGITAYELAGTMDRPDARNTCEQICSELTQLPDGAYELSDACEASLDEQGVWGLLVGPDCRMLWSYGVPSDVDLPTTVQDFAMLAHYGYIGDYPAFVYSPAEETVGYDGSVWAGTEIEQIGRQAVGTDKLLVIAYPPDSFVTIATLSFTQSDFETVTSGAVVIFAANLVILLAGYLVSRRSILRALAPLSSGIEKLARGETVRVEVGGDLSDIADDVNAAADVIRRKDAARANWISGVSHDIRTPLSSVLGYADRIAQDERNPESTRSEAAIIRAQGLRMRDLVEDLNLATKLEYDLQPLRPKPCPIAALARKAVAEFADATEANVHTVEFEADPQLESLQFEADERLLSRALRNLLQNSAVHNPGGCRILVKLAFESPTAFSSCGTATSAPFDAFPARGQRTTAAWSLSVSDDGIGVSQETLAELRNGPSSLGDATQRRDDGFASHGLGLMLVKGIVRVHGGILLLDSPGIGKGFSSKLVFPLRSPSPFDKA